MKGFKQFLMGLAVVLTVSAAYGLYYLSDQVARLQSDIDTLNAKILDRQRSVEVLEAEWAHLNRPEYLQNLTARHLSVRPVRPDQVGVLASVPAGHYEPDIRSFPIPRPRPGSEAAAHLVSYREGLTN